MRKISTVLSTICLCAVSSAQKSAVPQVEVSNGFVKAKIYLPDAKNGYYRGTRFDWSGVIGSLEYGGHNYYGPWFTKTDPKVNDFIYDGEDITAGPCSAAVGPVDEFLANGTAVGYDEAAPGGTFIKIGVGVLRKPDTQKYSSYRLYDIVDSGKWTVRPGGQTVGFMQEVSDASSGYGYVYEKIVRLTPGQPEMIIGHRLKNTGRKAIRTSVYNHNFLVLDGATIGSDFVISVPFEIKTSHPPAPELAAILGNEIVYLKQLRGRDTVATPVEGFGDTASDYKIRIRNKKTGAAMTIAGDRPLVKEALWSIRSVLAMEPFVEISIEPGRDFNWLYTYRYSAN
jgi:hypothetical protein